jgi:hypothetical protein
MNKLNVKFHSLVEMDKLFEKHALPKLYKKETKMISSIFIRVIAFVKIVFQQRKHWAWVVPSTNPLKFMRGQYRSHTNSCRK